MSPEARDPFGFARPTGFVTPNDDLAALLSNSAALGIMAGA
jgi:hypothetical protein